MVHERSSGAAAALCLGLICAAGLGLAFLARHETWDDAAITLGYSRTLAATGSIQFGRFGERVEGFSSVLWMLVGTRLARQCPDPERLLESARRGRVLRSRGPGLSWRDWRCCLSRWWAWRWRIELPPARPQ